MLKKIGFLVSVAALVSIASGCGASKATITVSDSSATATSLAQNMGTSLKTTLVAAGMTSADADTVVITGVRGASAIRLGGSSKFSAASLATVTSIAPVLANSTVAAFALLTSMSAADKETHIGDVIDGIVAGVAKYKDGSENLESLHSEVVKSSTSATGSVFSASSDLDSLKAAQGVIIGRALKNIATLALDSSTAIAAIQTKSIEGLQGMSASSDTLSALIAGQSQNMIAFARVVVTDDTAYLVVTAKLSGAAFDGAKTAGLDLIITPENQAKAQALGAAGAAKDLPAAMGQQMLAKAGESQIEALKTKHQLSDADLASATKAMTSVVMTRLGEFVAAADLSTWSGKVTDGNTAGLLGSGMSASGSDFSTATANMSTAATEVFTKMKSDGKISGDDLSAAVSKMQERLDATLTAQGVLSAVIAALKTGFGDASIGSLSNAEGMTDLEKQAVLTSFSANHPGFKSPMMDGFLGNGGDGGSQIGGNNPQGGGASPSPSPSVTPASSLTTAGVAATDLAGTWIGSTCMPSGPNEYRLKYVITANNAVTGTIAYSIVNHMASGGTCLGTVMASPAPVSATFTLGSYNSGLLLRAFDFSGVPFGGFPGIGGGAAPGVITLDGSHSFRLGVGSLGSPPTSVDNSVYYEKQ